MKYISLFSGIEAATVAWEPLGWEPVCFAEFDEFPSAVLAERYPEVPNIGDVTKMVILSIKPEFVEKIFSGEKSTESLPVL